MDMNETSDEHKQISMDNEFHERHFGERTNNFHVYTLANH